MIKIEDRLGSWFLIEVWTPSLWNRVSPFRSRWAAEKAEWRSLDEGYINVSGGDAWRTFVHQAGHHEVHAYHLVLLYPNHLEAHGYDGTGPLPRGAGGIVLRDYDDRFGTYDRGDGKVVQSWVLGLEPGEIKWSKATWDDIYNAPLRQTPAVRAHKERRRPEEEYWGPGGRWEHPIPKGK